MTVVERIECMYGNRYRIKTSRTHDLNETYKKIDVCPRSGAGKIDNIYVLQDFTIPVWIHNGRQIEKKVMKIPHCSETMLMNLLNLPVERMEYSENARRFKDSSTRKDLIHSNLTTGGFNTLHLFVRHDAEKVAARKHA